jgi:hypothetical protein
MAQEPEIWPLRCKRSFSAGSPQLDANKPQTLAFLAYLDEAETTLTIVHVFANAAGFAAHVEGAGDRSDAASEFIESVRLTIHGAPTASSLEAVRASTPPDVPIEVRDAFVAGFLRVPGGS